MIDMPMGTRTVKGIIWIFAGCFVLLTIFQDLLEANFQQSSFYLSESFLFSSFWWLFIPFLYAQFTLTNQKNTKGVLFTSLLIVAPILLHLFSFPAVIWLFSKLFYENTFRYQQTFQFTVSVHLYQLVLFYSLPLFIYRFVKQKLSAKPIEDPSTFYETSLQVNEGSKRLAVVLADVLYFSANSPYITIHLKDKQYLYNESLKSLATKVNPNQFIRIHKSTIVNIKHVQSYTSRLNGDYDLALNDGTILRVSRNYAAAFKESHRVALK